MKQWINKNTGNSGTRQGEGSKIQWGDGRALVTRTCAARRAGAARCAYARGTQQKLSIVWTVTNKGKARSG